MQGAWQRFGWLLAIAAIACPGCGGRTPDEKRDDRTMLLEIHMGWEFFHVAKKKDPANLEELAEGIRNGGSADPQKVVGRIGSGAYVVNFGATTSQGPDTVLAYEAGAASSGGYVLTADGTISEMSASSLKSKLGK